MSDSIFLVYFDPSEVEAGTSDPAYLRGVFKSRRLATETILNIAGTPEDPRWTVVEESLGEVGWTDGFVTVRMQEDDENVSS